MPLNAPDMKLVFGLAASPKSIQAKNPPSRAMALNRIPLVGERSCYPSGKYTKPDEKHQMGIEPTPLDWKSDVLSIKLLVHIGVYSSGI